MIKKIVDLLAGLNEAIGLFAQRLAAMLLMIMLAVVISQVLFRYGLNNPISWAEELSKTLMVWSAFMIMPFAFREGINVSIDLFKDAWSRRVRFISELIIDLLILWIVSVFFWESILLVGRAMKVSAASLPVSAGVLYSILPVSFAALILAVIERLLRIMIELNGGSDETAIKRA